MEVCVSRVVYILPADRRQANFLYMAFCAGFLLNVSDTLSREMIQYLPWLPVTPTEIPSVTRAFAMWHDREPGSEAHTNPQLRRRRIRRETCASVVLQIPIDAPRQTLYASYTSRGDFLGDLFPIPGKSGGYSAARLLLARCPRSVRTATAARPYDGCCRGNIAACRTPTSGRCGHGLQLVPLCEQ